MRRVEGTLPELAFVAVTRGLTGLGVGLLLSEFIDDKQVRRGLGWTLLGIGAATTVPIAMKVFGNRQPPLLAD